MSDTSTATLLNLEVAELVQIIESSLEAQEDMQIAQRPMIERLSVQGLTELRNFYQKQIDVYLHPHLTPKEGGFGDLRPRELGVRKVYPKHILKQKIEQLDKEINQRANKSSFSKK